VADNKFFAAKKKEITKSIAAALLTEGRVFIKGLYSEKTGKTYDATVSWRTPGSMPTSNWILRGGAAHER
jgi:DNA topoisomerase-3